MTEHQDATRRFASRQLTRLGFAMAVCVAAIGLIFVAVPFYRERELNHREREAAARNAKVVRARADALLHTFDCTYGAVMKDSLTEAARVTRRQADLAEEAQRFAEDQGAHGAAVRLDSLQENSLRAAVRFEALYFQLEPLGSGAPCK